MITQGETFGVVESVEAASDLYAPLSGEVLAASTALNDSPDLVNKEPFQGGWMLKVRPADTSELDGLMDAGAYDLLSRPCTNPNADPPSVCAPPPRASDLADPGLRTTSDNE